MLVSVSSSAAEADYAHSFAETRQVASFRELAKIICGPRRWSPITWHGGQRRQDNFEQAELVVLDFDDGKLTVEAAAVHFKAEGVRFLLGTTKSHRIPKGNAAAQDRFRVILHMDRPVTHLPRYKQNMRRILQAYPADQACCDGARIYRPCTQIVAFSDGEQIPMLPYQAPQPLDKSRFIDGRLVGRPPKWVSELLRVDCPGSRNSTVFRVAARLASYGYPESDIRRIVTSSAITLEAREMEAAIGSGIRAGQKAT